MGAADGLGVGERAHKVLVKEARVEVERGLLARPLGIAHPTALLALAAVGRDGVEVGQLGVNNGRLNPVEDLGVDAGVAKVDVSPLGCVRVHEQ